MNELMTSGCFAVKRQCLIAAEGLQLWMGPFGGCVSLLFAVHCFEPPSLGGTTISASGWAAHVISGNSPI